MVALTFFDYADKTKPIMIYGPFADNAAAQSYYEGLIKKGLYMFNAAQFTPMTEMPNNIPV